MATAMTTWNKCPKGSFTIVDGVRRKRAPGLLQQGQGSPDKTAMTTWNKCPKGSFTIADGVRRNRAPGVLQQGQGSHRKAVLIVARIREDTTTSTTDIPCASFHDPTTIFAVADGSRVVGLCNGIMDGPGKLPPGHPHPGERLVNRSSDDLFAYMRTPSSWRRHLKSRAKSAASSAVNIQLLKQLSMQFCSQPQPRQ